MHRMTVLWTFILMSLGTGAIAGEGAPTGNDKIGKLPHVEFDAQKKQVRVECEMLAVAAPLEFFCCVKGSNDYEAMIRSEVKPSDLHFALLGIGQKPGQPLKYSEAARKWIPPQGPPLQIVMEYEKDGKTVGEPAWKWMRDVHSKKSAPPFMWVFAGSRVMPDGKYAADVTGYLVSIVNFDLTVIDVPELASSSNDLLEWERNPDITPKAGTKVWMVIEPAGNEHAKPRAAPATRASAVERAQSSSSSQPQGDIDAQIADAQKNINALQDEWEKKVAPHRAALRQAAEAHYKVVQDLRAQQQRLIDEADRIQRTIDDLEKQYQDLTTPRPESK